MKEVLTSVELNTNNDSSLDPSCDEIYNQKILREYTNDDLRVMIGQGIGLDILVPFALDLLEENIFAEGELYPGDLLASLVEINSDYWNKHSDDKSLLKLIINRNIKVLQVAFDKI